MITFEQIQEVNKSMNGIDFKGKNYVMVNSRVTAFRKLFPEGFIHTDIISLDNGTVVMKAEVGYYENGNKVILGTGLAYEREQTSYINKTSFIENCETSAVGRALGFLALGNDDSICSAEELVNALKSQEQIKAKEKAECQPPIPSGGSVETAAKVPDTQEISPVGNYIRNEIADIQELMGLKNYQDAKRQVLDWYNSLLKAKAVQKVDWVNITMEQAKDVFKAIRDTYKPGEAA